MKSASFFSTLPPELICEVFKCVDDFSVVAALAQTARIFYYTWRQNPTSICRAVAPRVISNLADAERLLDMQEEADPTAEPVSQDQDGRLQKSIVRARRLQSNAHRLSAASDDWVSFCQDYPWPDRGHDDMKPSELARFEHAFYCVWTIGVMGNTPHLQDQASVFLSTCAPRELFRLYEMSSWADFSGGNNSDISGFKVHEGVAWKSGCDLVVDHWEDRVDRGLRVPPECELPHTPMEFYAFFDHTQKFLEYFPDE